jgi:hypothetical protein
LAVFVLVSGLLVWSGITRLRHSTSRSGSFSGITFPLDLLGAGRPGVGNWQQSCEQSSASTGEKEIVNEPVSVGGVVVERLVTNGDETRGSLGPQVVWGREVARGGTPSPAHLVDALSG